MIPLEDRLRDAYRAVADTVDPATIPDPAEGRQAPARQSRRMRFLMPFGAAAAVTVVAIVTTLSVGILPQRAQTAPRHHTRAVKTHATAAPPSLPAFTIVDQSSSLQVYATRTGVAVAALKAPKGQLFQDVASGGVAGTFLAATGLSSSACHAYFYRFQLSASGQPSRLTFLRSVSDSQPTAITATPGGGTYAYSTVHCVTAPPNGGVGIRGQAGNRDWTYPTGDDYAMSLSATADGRTLAFSVYISSFVDVLLNTRSPSSTVAGASRILPIPFSQTLAISPDGQTVYACSTNSSTATLASYSAATGAQIRVLHQWPVYTQGFVCQISTDRTGRYLIAATTPDVQQRSTLTGFDLQTGGSATVPVHPDLPFQGTQLAW